MTAMPNGTRSAPEFRFLSQWRVAGTVVVVAAHQHELERRVCGAPARQRAERRGRMGSFRVQEVTEKDDATRRTRGDEFGKPREVRARRAARHRHAQRAEAHRLAEVRVGDQQRAGAREVGCLLRQQFERLAADLGLAPLRPSLHVIPNQPRAGTVYAVGGAKARGTRDSDLARQVDWLLIDRAPLPQDALYVVMIGGNDAIDGLKADAANPMAAVKPSTAVVKKPAPTPVRVDQYERVRSDICFVVYAARCGSALMRAWTSSTD